MSGVASAPRDAAARLTASIDASVNLVVAAGAGTGKTTLLVERILHAIGSGTARLPEIAAITFTEKAAGELRHRLAAGLDALADAAHGREAAESGARAFARLVEGGSPAPEIAARVEAARGALDRASVSTIHAFCADLLRSHPVESGLIPGFTVDQGPLARRLIDPAWEAFVTEELGPAGRRGALWGRVLATATLADASEVARALVKGAVPDDVLAHEVAPLDLRRAFGAEALAWADELRDAGTATGLADTPRAWLAEAERALRTFAAEGDEAARRTIDRSERLDKPLTIGKRVGGEDRAKIDALSRRVGRFLKALRKLDAAAALDLLEAVRPFARAARASLLGAGIVDFDGLLVRARDLLRDHPAVRDGVKRRFRMLLLDEFQDTDPLQYEIVFFIAEVEGERERDAYATELAPGRLFIVGDAKQSIYRFRGADYAAYRRAVSHVVDQGGMELSLTTNFRSVPGVLTPINALFTAPSPSWKPSAHLPPYEAIEAHRPGDGEVPCVEVWSPLLPKKALAVDRRRLEAAALAREIGEFAGPGKRWRYGDVLLLLRGFQEAGIYLRALRAQRVPFVVSGGRSFFERTEIVQALAVLRAVADPADEIALLAYLRSPAGGVDDRELAVHAQHRDHPWRPETPASRDRTPLLAAAVDRLASMRADVASLPLDETIRRVLETSGMITLSGLAFEAAQRVANLEKLIVAANALCRDGSLTLRETLDAIEESLELDEEGDSPLADEAMDAVRVMTIHKAKGLEARVVILADTATRPSYGGREGWSIAMAPTPEGARLALSGPGLRNAAAVFAALDDLAHERAEHLRLLYVALTRARDRLVVFGGGEPTMAWIAAFAAWGYTPKELPDDGPLRCGDVLHRRLAMPPRETVATDAVPAGAPAAVERYEEALAAVDRLAAPEMRAPSGVVHEVERNDRGTAPDLAREIGSVVHARLSGLAPPTTDDEASRRADELMKAFDASPLRARLDALDVLGREIPVLFDDGGARWRGAIDLLYREGDGTIVVADYKTDAVSEGAVERHAHQLGVYAKAVARAIGATVRAELWMLRTGEILEVQSSGVQSSETLNAEPSTLNPPVKPRAGTPPRKLF